MTVGMLYVRMLGGGYVGYSDITSKFVVGAPPLTTGQLPAVLIRNISQQKSLQEKYRL